MCFSQECDSVEAEAPCVTQKARLLTKTSHTWSDVSNKIRQEAESKGLNETQ